MTDAELRLALKSTVLAHHYSDPEAVIVEELGIKHGAARVDIAVVNGQLHGFEIKGDRDTLARLPQQVRLYDLILDLASIVVAKKHLAKVVNIIPDWWGVEVAQETAEGSIEFFTLRQAEPNPHKNLFSVVQLLQRSEALEILEELGEAKGYRSKPRLSIYKKLLQLSDTTDIAARVREKLKIRKTR